MGKGEPMTTLTFVSPSFHCTDRGCQCCHLSFLRLFLTSKLLRDYLCSFANGYYCIFNVLTCSRNVVKRLLLPMPRFKVWREILATVVLCGHNKSRARLEWWERKRSGAFDHKLFFPQSPPHASPNGPNHSLS